MLIEAITFAIVYYLFCSLGYYGYAVIKSWEYTNVWRFKLEDGYIGICKYPKWALCWVEGWVEWLTTKIRGAR